MRAPSEVKSGRAMKAAPGHRGTSPARTAIIPGHWFVVVLGISALILALSMRHAGLRIELESTSTALFVGAAAVMAALRYVFRHPSARWQQVVRDVVEYIGLFVFTGLLGAIGAYPAASVTHGFADPALEHIDRLFRFNWLAWYDLVVAHPALQTLGRIVYASIFVTPGALFIHYALSRQQGEARRFIATFWVAGVITLLWFMRFPAQGPLAVLWHGPIPYMPFSALYQAELIPLLRDHTIHDIDMGALRGLVCAPSFHTTSAVIYIVAASRVPSLRWPLIALNVAMLLSIPVEGNHYLTDMICGTVVAVSAMLLTSAGVRAMGARRAARRGVGGPVPYSAT